jgi:SpoVK/Ycf46/Vps4 family AAA+-type ATPase
MVETVMNSGYKDSLEHLISELKRIKLILLSRMKINGVENSQVMGDDLNTMYLPVMDTKFIQSIECEESISNSDMDTINQSLHKLEAEINLKKRESQRVGVKLALCELQSIFDLSTFDIDVILMCLLPELDSRFERYHAYLQDDITKKTPTVGIILRLLCSGLEDTLVLKQAFSPNAPLIKNNLIRLDNELAQTNPALMAKLVRIDERIADYLTGRHLIDYRIRSFTRFYQPKITLNELAISRDLRERLSRFTVSNKKLMPVYYFHGVNGIGKRTVAEAVCHDSGISLLHLDVKHMLAADLPLHQSVPLVFREGRLQNAAIYLSRSDLLFNSDSPDLFTGCALLLRELEEFPNICFLSSDTNIQPVNISTSKISVNIEFSLPSHSIRKQLWQKLSNIDTPLADDIDIDTLAGKFRLTAGQIAGALSIARSLAVWRDPENGLITSSDLHSACRQQSRRGLNTLTRQIGSEYTWDDIILPRDQKEQLIEICNQVKYGNTVYNEWGFGHKLSRGKGMNILFSGPSGTGKTMAAEIMGNELSIDLYKIDLSAIVSKYIGETEKNLDRIFSEGTTANAIIFFDEADSLFGKRSEVRDSHDRYANIEISYLLQKMEEYDGIIILATNLRKNIDEAFARRMNFAVEFPIPQESDRYRIWESIFPEEAPLGQDLDLYFLARQFTITGGNIRNIVLASAFLAAQDGGLITMENIIRATKREYQKMGKLCTENDFAHYFDLVKG